MAINIRVFVLRRHHASPWASLRRVGTPLTEEAGVQPRVGSRRRARHTAQVAALDTKQQIRLSDVVGCNPSSRSQCRAVFARWLCRDSLECR